MRSLYLVMFTFIGVIIALAMLLGSFGIAGQDIPGSLFADSHPWHHQQSSQTAARALPWQLDAISIGSDNDHTEEDMPFIPEVHGISSLGKTTTCVQPHHNDRLRVRG